jgi:hypothetical protein
MIKEFERYHGVVLREIVVSAEASTTLRAFDDYGRVNSFIVGDEWGLHIKHSSKRLPPWQFTFHDDHIEEISGLEKQCPAGVWIALACGDDGVVLITPDELRGMNEWDEQRTWFVRVTRDRHTMYHLNGSAADLPFAKPRGVTALVSLLNGGVQL